MAKGNKKTEGGSVINVAMLAAIAAGTMVRISQGDALPLLQHNPPLIEVNGQDVVDGMATVRITPAGQAMAVPAQVNGESTTSYSVITNAIPPASKRRGRLGGGTTQYPWDVMPVGGSFFVPVSAKHEDPVKNLQSAVSAANMKYSEPTGETKTVTRSKRGVKNKAVLDANGDKIMETVTVDVRKPIKKFGIRGVEAGVKYGDWTAESNGALIFRMV